MFKIFVYNSQAKRALSSIGADKKKEETEADFKDMDFSALDDDDMVCSLLVHSSFHVHSIYTLNK